MRGAGYGTQGREEAGNPFKDHNSVFRRLIKVARPVNRLVGIQERVGKSDHGEEPEGRPATRPRVYKVSKATERRACKAQRARKG